MTKEQIARKIDFVDSVMQSHFNDYGEETHRALQEAIELIEQEPKTGHWVYSNNYESYIPRDYVIALLEDKKRTRKEITNRIYECVGVQINEDN